MLVAELKENVSFKENTPVKKLSDVVLDDEGLKLSGEREVITWDEEAMKKLGRYLGVSPTYLRKCPQDLMQYNVNYWLQRYGETEAMFRVHEGTLTAVHNPDKKLIPVKPVADIIGRVFNEDDEVRNFWHDIDRIHLDVTTKDLQVDVPGNGDMERGRPKVGDVTHGGLRFFLYPTKEQRPYVQTFFHRLWCSNGSGVDEPDFQVQLKGSTVPEILASMEENAQKLLEQMPLRLEQLKASAEVPFEGNVEQFIHQMSRERGISSRVMSRLLDAANDLPSDPSAYDVTQMFTQMAQQGVSYRTRLRLERLGGDLSVHTHEVLHRCTTCERVL